MSRVLNHDFTRIFVLYPKSATENELNVEFERYWPIEYFYVQKENETSLEKGSAYIKYTKASHAAKSIEELDGKFLSNRHSTPLKLLILDSTNDNKSNSIGTIPMAASNASFFSSRINSLPTQASTTATSTNVMVCSDNDNDRMFRLFVKIPKCFREKYLREAFLKFGEIENVQILYKNKGFGYVRYYKASDAARALEECDSEFYAQYADPYSVKLLRDKKSKKIWFLIDIF